MTTKRKAPRRDEEDEFNCALFAQFCEATSKHGPNSTHADLLARHVDHVQRTMPLRIFAFTFGSGVYATRQAFATAKASHAAFVGAVNRVGMSREDQKAAFNKFFGIR